MSPPRPDRESRRAAQARRRLLEFETLTGEESKRAIKGEDIGRDDPFSKPPLIPASGARIPSTRKPRGPGIGPAAPQGA
jgi:cell division protease FtsH